MANERRLFLIDAVGALVSALMLGVALPLMQERIGLPRPVLLVLAAIALLLMAYSLAHTSGVLPARPARLRALIACNIAYGALTTVLLAAFASEVKALGFVYFIAELCVLSAIVWFEIRGL